jgi:hypothetical protein
MKHLTKPTRAIHFVVLAFLMTFGSQVSAKDILVGGAFDCESTQAMKIKPFDEKYQKASKQTFTLIVEAQKVRFLAKDGGYVNDVTLGKKYHQPHLLSAYSDFASFTLERKENGKRFRFHYVDAMFSRSYAMFGYCRKY